MDALCIEANGYIVRLMTHRQKITVDIEKDGRLILNEWITPIELISRLMSRTHR